MESELPQEIVDELEPKDPEYPSLGQFVTPVDGEYVGLIGFAVFAFGNLEWNVVHVGNKIAPGFIEASSKMTAGNMAKAMIIAADNFAGDHTLKVAITDVSTNFAALVPRRNDLVHGHPASVRGYSRQHYWSKDHVFTWEPADIVAFTHEVEALAQTANTLFYDSRMPR